jgi:hypothetical protein
LKEQPKALLHNSFITENEERKPRKPGLFNKLLTVSSGLENGNRVLFLRRS